MDVMHHHERFWKRTSVRYKFRDQANPGRDQEILGMTAELRLQLTLPDYGAWNSAHKQPQTISKIISEDRG